MGFQSTKNVISVVIPTYNRFDLLNKVIPSYTNQPEVKEVIVIDDCSNQNNSNKLRDHYSTTKKIVFHRNIKNLGAPESRNIGVKMSKGDYIFFGEDDLELEPKFFTTLLDHMFQTQADIIAGRRIWMGQGESRTEALKRVSKLTGSPVNFQLITSDCQKILPDDQPLPLVDASMLIKKSVLENVSYDSMFSVNAFREETDFQISAQEKGYKIVYCPHVMAWHLFKPKNTGGNHSASVLTYEWNVWKNNYKFVLKHRSFLKRNFKIPNLPLYFVNFTLSRLLEKYTLPFVVKTKQKFLG